MRSLNIKITEDQHEAIRQLAFDNKKSIASIVREMIKDGLDVAALEEIPKEEE